MKVDLDNRQSDVQIEILPMIDVIFCILTFFILAAVGLTRQQVIDLALPAVNNSVPVAGNARERLYVSVDSAGQVYVDANAVPITLLRDVVQRHKQRAPNGTVVLYASNNARYEDVVQVLDLLREVGGNRVSLATLPKGASLDPTQGNPFSGTEGGVPGQPIPGSPSPDGVQINPLPSGSQPGGSFGLPSGSQPGGSFGLPSGGAPGSSSGSSDLPAITPGSPGAPVAPPASDSSSP